MRCLVSLKLGQVLCVMVVVPATGLLWFASADLHQLATAKSQGADALRLAQLATRTSDLMHALQLERGLTAGVLATGGSYFVDRLSLQRVGTNAAMSRFRHGLGTIASDTFADELDTVLERLRDDLDGLADARDRMTAGGMDFEATLAYFTTLNERLLGLVAFLPRLTSVSEFSVDGLAYLNLLFAKEQAGRERAGVMGVLARRGFGAGGRGALASTMAAQDVYFELFRLVGHPGYVAGLESKLTDPFIQRSEAIRARVLNEDWLVANPVDYFELQTAKLEALRSVERAVAGHLLEAMKAVQARTERRLNEALSVAIGLLLLVLAIGIVTARVVLRQLGAEPDVLLEMTRSIGAGDLSGEPEGGRLSSGVGEGIRIMRQQLRDRAAEARAAEERIGRLAAAVEHALDGVAICDADGIIVYCNPSYERWHGLSVSDLAGRRPNEFLQVPTGSDVETGLAIAMATGHAWSGRRRSVQSDGRPRAEDVTVSPVIDETGAIGGYVLIGRDVTDRLELEDQLAQAHKLEAIGQLAAGVAHEINTPMQYVGDSLHFLSGAFGDLDVLVRRLSDLAGDRGSGALADADMGYLAEEIPRALAAALDGAGRVSTIVGAMKEFSHPANEKTAIDLNRAIASTITVSRNEWKYVAEVVTDFGPDLAAVPCVPGEFNQVMLNLIVNAAHAIGDAGGGCMREKGRITVATRVSDRWAEVRVSDTGPGIPEAIRGRIFEPFFTTKDVGRGTGQGLAIAHDIVVKRHAGSIRVESDVGVGSTFIIRLPLVAEGTASERVEAAPDHRVDPPAPGAATRSTEIAA